MPDSHSVTKDNCLYFKLGRNRDELFQKAQVSRPIKIAAQSCKLGEQTLDSLLLCLYFVNRGMGQDL